MIESIDEGGDGDASTVEEKQAKFGKIPVVAVNDTTSIEKMNDRGVSTLCVNSKRGYRIKRCPPLFLCINAGSV